MTGPPPPGDRLGRYRIGRAALVALLAGRGTYRLIQVAATVLLLPAWGTQRYGVYATAVASFSWLTALVFTGPEKTVLKLLPRAARTGRLITEAFLVLLWWLPVPPLLAYAAVAVRHGGTPALYVGVATMLLCNGCTLLLIGLHRAVGRLRSDVGSFLVMSVVQLLLLGAAIAGWLDPLGYVSVMIASQLGLNAVLALRLGRPSLRIRQRRGYLGRIAWTAVLMSGAEVCMYLSTAVLFGMLAASSWASQISGLFVVMIVWSVSVNLLVYVLRVYAPRTSLRLAGRAGHGGRQQAARLSGAVAASNLLWLAVVWPLVTLTDVAAVGSARAQLVLWIVLFASRAPSLAALIWTSYLLENTDARAPRVTGLAAAAGLATAAVTGSLTVPALGGAGAIIGFATAELVQSLIIAAGGRGRTPQPAPAGSRRGGPAPTGSATPAPSAVPGT